MYKIQTVYLPVKVEEYSNYHIFDLHECEGSYIKTVAEGYGYFLTSEQLNEYTQSVIKQTLETAKNNLRQASGTFNSDYFSQKQSITNTFEEVYLKFKQ